MRRNDKGAATHRTCCDCGELKPVAEFPRNAAASTGRASYCEPCHSVRSRARHLRKKYGLTPAQHASIVAGQGGLCAVCRKRPAEHTDHDHKTGELRSLLCQHCNQGLGHFFDDPALLHAAAAYLEVHRGLIAPPLPEPPERRRVPREPVAA